MAVTARERVRQAEECMSSGLPVKVWCRENGVASSTMYEWIRRVRGGEAASGSPAFLEVSVEPARAAVATAAGIVVRIGPAELVLPACADERDVAVAMRAAAAL